MTSAEPCACTRPIPAAGNMICPVCHAGLRRDLTQTPGLVKELDVTILKLDRIGPESLGGGAQHHAPVPVNLHAAQVRAQLVGCVQGIYTALHTNAPMPALVTAGARIGHDPRVASHAMAPVWVAALAMAVKAAAQAIDLPASLVYAGTCGGLTAQGIPCTVELYARTGQATVECRTCGTSWDVEARRAAALAVIEDQVLTPEKISRALAAYGLGIDRHNMGYWHRAGYLEQHKVLGRIAYRVGDVMDVYSQMRAKRVVDRRQAGKRERLM